jgi:hypothetical protein
MKAWASAFKELPDCVLKSSLADRMARFADLLGPEMASAFAGAMGTAYRRHDERRTDAMTNGVASQDSGLRIQEQEGAPSESAPLVLSHPNAPVPETDKPKRKPSGPHQEAVDHFHRRYVDRHGHKPTWKGKNASLIADLVGTHGADEVKRRTDIAFDAPPSFLVGQVIDVGTLSTHFDKFAVAATPRAGPIAPTPRRMPPSLLPRHQPDEP